MRSAAHKTTRIGQTNHRPPLPLHGALATGAGRSVPGHAGDSSAYPNDSVPLSPLATVLRTLPPPPAPALLARAPCRGGPVPTRSLPVSCSIVRHNFTACAALESSSRALSIPQFSPVSSVPSVHRIIPGPLAESN